MKTITVKGVGTAKVKPDYIVLSMSLNTTHKDYGTAMDKASEKIELLNKSLEEVGFEKDAVKTSSFDVHADYISKKDVNGNYYRVFNGYVVSHRLKVSFDFDTSRLSRVLRAVADCVADPELSVDFTVKDTSVVNELLLVSATENAQRKAEILCKASNVKLNELVTVDYSWGEINVYSPTKYELDDKCMCDCLPRGIDIEPEDIKASDTVTFVWSIL